MKRAATYTIIAMTASVLAACGSLQPGNSASIAHAPTQSAMQPSPTASTVHLQGSACHSSLWGNAATSAGQYLALPPHTYAGLAETFPPENGWTGHYQRYCTDGSLNNITDFFATMMPQEGWSFGLPPPTCLCGGVSGWSHLDDGRIVQIDSHPAIIGISIEWGITIYTHG